MPSLPASLAPFHSTTLLWLHWCLDVWGHIRHALTFMHSSFLFLLLGMFFLQILHASSFFFFWFLIRYQLLLKKYLAITQSYPKYLKLLLYVIFFPSHLSLPNLFYIKQISYLAHYQYHNSTPGQVNSWDSSSFCSIWYPQCQENDPTHTSID